MSMAFLIVAELVLDLVHRDLVVAVGVQLPAGVGDRLDHAADRPRRRGR